MCLKRRLTIAAGCLTVGLLGQWALQWHLASGEPDCFPALTRNLAQLPLEFATESPLVHSAWLGKVSPNEESLRRSLPFRADEIISRSYGNDKGDAPVDLYMVYSREGEDRKHHPEICIRDVAGATELTRARKTLFLDSEKKRPIMRFCFQTGTNQFVTVYYWHYTLHPASYEGKTFLQVVHQKMSRPAPSLTVQAAIHASERLEHVEDVFLRWLDGHLRREHLPPSATMGCERLPIALIRE